MKPTRKIDDLGRIVIPSDLREQLNLVEQDSMDISIEDSRIILERHQPTCVFCHSADDLFPFEAKHVCSKCKERISI